MIYHQIPASPSARSLTIFIRWDRYYIFVLCSQQTKAINDYNVLKWLAGHESEAHYNYIYQCCWQFRK